VHVCALEKKNKKKKKKKIKLKLKLKYKKFTISTGNYHL
jgi:hypothetical protein